MRRPRVTVWYSAKATWVVGVEGPLLVAPGEWRTVVVATYETRDSANEYAKGIRKALRGRSGAVEQLVRNARLRDGDSR